MTIPIGERTEQRYDEDLEQMLRELVMLSGRFGSREKHPPYLISNDRGYERVAGTVTERFRDRPGDIGVFVGGGAMSSWLPELGLQAAIMVDISRSVLDFNRYLLGMMAESGSAEEVHARLTDPDNIDPQAVKFLGGTGGGYKPDLGKEAAVYGANHWTDPRRFFQVKGALAGTPVVYLNADLTDDKFNWYFGGLLEASGHRVSFANLTNVAAYTLSTDFVERWPMDKDPMLVYSQISRPGNILEMNLAGSPREYRAANGHIPSGRFRNLYRGAVTD